jgi:O-methyltransferase involved in polyketide biosynthesis
MWHEQTTKHDQPLIDVPFAEPLVRAVGMDFFTRLAGGELDAAADDAVLHLRPTYSPCAHGFSTTSSPTPGALTSAKR